MDVKTNCVLFTKRHRQDSCSSVESVESDRSKGSVPDFEEESLFSPDEDKNEKDETSLLAAQQSEDKDGMKTSSRQQPAASAAC